MAIKNEYKYNFKHPVIQKLFESTRELGKLAESDKEYTLLYELLAGALHYAELHGLMSYTDTE